MFATAGEGFAPASVVRYRSDHDSVSESLPAPHTGTPDVWQDYANAGLYVFDWKVPGGPYERREVPIREPDQELRSAVMALPNLPRFYGSFSVARQVESWR